MWVRSSALDAAADGSRGGGDWEGNRLNRGCERNRCSARKIVLRTQVYGKDCVGALERWSVAASGAKCSHQRSGSPTLHPSLPAGHIHYVISGVESCNSCQRVVEQCSSVQQRAVLWRWDNGLS